MSCTDTIITMIDKYIACIRDKNPNYSYSIMHFSLDELGRPLYWNLEYPQPTSEQLESVVVVKKCPLECMGCILNRITILEAKIKTLEDDIK